MQKTMTCSLSWPVFTGAAFLIAAVWSTVQILTNDPEALAKHEGD